MLLTKFCVFYELSETILISASWVIWIVAPVHISSCSILSIFRFYPLKIKILLKIDKSNSIPITLILFL